MMQNLEQKRSMALDPTGLSPNVKTSRKNVYSLLCYHPVFYNTLHLEKHALGLLPVKFDVFDNEHPDQREGHHSSTTNDHVLLRERVRLLDRKTCLCALRVTELQLEILSPGASLQAKSVAARREVCLARLHR
jgi:hypothetical protein